MTSDTSKTTYADWQMLEFSDKLAWNTTLNTIKGYIHNKNEICV